MIEIVYWREYIFVALETYHTDAIINHLLSLNILNIQCPFFPCTDVTALPGMRVITVKGTSTVVPVHLARMEQHVWTFLTTTTTARVSQDMQVDIHINIHTVLMICFEIIDVRKMFKET